MNKNNLDLFSTKSYFYNLPEEKIAQSPAEPRDSARLLVYHKDNGNIENSTTYIINYCMSRL